ncbi:carbon-nitrogen hydrolase family protein [Emcibacter nanhaiensis]|uniref:Carbon-nitrogen hydrolase family protein n=1 Tax=Emcibacter nanhaiensis TaxID=1505037 RepID=A0A501PN69_9PROT|nr:carbon-nitrogen hydrolase family protein [Emcibacter nanhaiensis]TPD61394.1 carbon-nitrogen hydrolase family protein [Emcibacter nanhaiensis]
MTGDKFTIGLVQMTSSNEVAENVAAAEVFIREAAAGGAQLVMTPECTSLLELGRKALFAKIHVQDEESAVRRFSALAEELGIWLVIGSMPILVGDKVANRCFVFGPDGVLEQIYDKIHMFDVDLPNGEQYRESRSYQAGEQAVLADLPWGRMGLTICYDLRFPYLFRKLAQAGATMLSVPAAFTQQTGEAHWHTLLRARAIENGAFVFAPAQTGTHASGRKTYGHSLVIDPWGKILADGGTEPGVSLAEIDLTLVEAARTNIPSLQHDRPVKDPA